MNLFSKKPSKKELQARVSALELRASQTAPLLGTWVGPRGTIWPDRNYKVFSTEAYLKNVISKRCVWEIARAASTVPWDLFTKDSKGKRVKVEENHPIKKLLKRPNVEDSFCFLITSAVSYLPLAGNAYFEKIAPLTGPNRGIPQELHVLRPDRMKVQVDKVTGLKKGYEYEINGRKTQWEVDLITGESPILQTKTFHPLNDWYGLADVEPAARDIDISNSASNWKKNMMDNEGRPGMVVGVESGISDKVFDQVEKDIQNMKEGSTNAGKTFILEGVKSVSPYSFKPKELDFLKSDIEVSRRICIGAGVPPMLIGIPGESTFANFAEAREYFWDTAIFYYLTFIKDELNHWIFGVDEEDLFLDFIIDNVPALAPKRSRIWKRAQETDFLTIDEKREMVGKEKLPNGEGEIILVDSGKIPLSEVGLSEETEEEEDETRKRLLNEGYSQEEVNQFLGLPKDGDVADKSCGHTLQ